MVMMNRIHRGPVLAPRRVTLMGQHGIGKSSWAAQAAKAIFVQTEDGLANIDCDSFPLATTFDEVMQALAELYTEEHPYQTVVIDTVDWLERLIWEEVCKKHNVDSIESIGYAKGYSFALVYWRQVLDGLGALRNEKGMTIVLLAHTKVERYENPETEPYDRFVPKLHKLASALLQEWSDEVLFATYKVFTKQSDEGFSRKRTQGIGTGERVLRTSERPAFIAKNRLNLPDELPLEWSAYAHYFQGADGTSCPEGPRGGPGPAGDETFNPDPSF